MNEGQFNCRSSLWKQIRERRLKSALIRFTRGGTHVPPLLSGIDTIHDEPRVKSIAVEAFGRHLEGADASVPFSLDRFSKNYELPRERNGPIPRMSYTRPGIALQTISLSSSPFLQNGERFAIEWSTYLALLYLSHGLFAACLPDKLMGRYYDFRRHYG